MFRAGIPESGILRKHKVHKETLDDLLVFGYACKLFRDDEKAIYIDQGKHLIPWMGDETLRIDRYDGRGTLSDINSCEANREGYDTTRWMGLNESERKVEQLCDEERYYSLTSNEEEELLYKEEELKRQKANEFQYNYDDSPKDTDDDSNSQSSVPTVEQDDRPYVPRPELDVPADISIPKTIKENARIEKTAMFVSKQGLQMEILIKAKQANNAQFSFMNQADLLYKYYRHVVAAFKSGRYSMSDYGNTDESAINSASSTLSLELPVSTCATDPHATSAVNNYLHPSLAQAAFPPAPSLDAAAALAEQVSAPVPPALTYRPRADCAYTQLITRIKGAQQLHKEQQGGGKEAEDAPVVVQQPPTQPGDVAGPLTVDQQQQYFHYYYTMRYYEGYKVMGEQYTAQGLDPQLLLQNVSIQEQIQQQAVQYAQAAVTAYMAQFSNTAQPSVATVPSAQASPVDQTALTAAVGQTEATNTQAAVVQTATPVTTVKAVNPLLTLAHYGSDSDEENEENEDCDNGTENKENDKATQNDSSSHTTKSEGYLIPPEDVSVIVDKMAAYVSKNGADFENIVRNRGDPRFEFLNPNHDFHSYYKIKLKEHLGLSTQNKDKSSSKNITQNSSASEIPTTDNKTQNASTETKQNDTNDVPLEKKLPVPVSFSIKIREESQIEIKPSALPIEESSDEEDIETNTVNNADLTAVTVKNDIDTIQSLKATAASIRNATSLKEVPIVNSNTLVNEIIASVTKNRASVESKVSKGVVIDITEGGKNNEDDEKIRKRGEISCEDDSMLDMIDLTDDLDDIKNEDSTKSSKLTPDQQQRALQLERRRKAAAFLRLRIVMEQSKAIDNQNDTKVNITDIHEHKTVVSGNSKRKGDTSSKESVETKAVQERAQSVSSDVVEIIDDSEDDGVKEKEKKKSSRRKKSHKRKHSKSSRSHRDGSREGSSSSRHKSKKHKKSMSNSDKSRSKIRSSRSKTRSSSRSS